MRLLGGLSRAGAVRLTRVLFASLVVAGACLGPSTALASGVWSAPTDIGSSFFPQSVSCSSATFCAAVGDNISGYAETATSYEQSGGHHQDISGGGGDDRWTWSQKDDQDGCCGYSRDDGRVDTGGQGRACGTQKDQALREPENEHQDRIALSGGQALGCK